MFATITIPRGLRGRVVSGPRRAAQKFTARPFLELPVIAIETPTMDRLSGVMPLALDTRGLARMLGVNRTTIIRMDRMHELPAAALDRHKMKRWSTDEIRDWLRAGCPDRQKWNAMRRSASLAR